MTSGPELANCRTDRPVVARSPATFVGQRIEIVSLNTDRFKAFRRKVIVLSW